MIPRLDSTLIAIGVELECRSVARSLSGRDTKEEPDALIAAESEIVDLVRRLKLIRRSDSSMLAIGVEPEYRFVARSLSGWGPKGEFNASIAGSEVADFLSQLKLIQRSNSCIIAIGIETEYRSITRSLSRWGPKGQSNAPIAAESEIADFLSRLKLIQRSDSSMLAIRLEPQYRSVARSLSGWGPKGEPNASITAESKVTDFLRRRHSCSCSSDLL
jgi:hypothetical protein